MLRELAPQPGQTLLELACGAGDTGFDAAALTGDGGRLISSDISPVMLDVARRRGAERGVLNVDYRLLDLERIELGDDTVDGVLCRFAYMLVADPAAALAETRRVLRPGGRVVLAVWGAPERNPFFTALGMALVRAGHVPPPDPTRPGLFSLGDPERVRGLLEGAGFTDVRVGGGRRCASASPTWTSTSPSTPTPRDRWRSCSRGSRRPSARARRVARRRPGAVPLRPGLRGPGRLGVAVAG